MSGANSERVKDNPWEGGMMPDEAGLPDELEPVELDGKPWSQVAEERGVAIEQ